MSNVPFDSSELGRVDRDALPAPIACPLAFVLTCDDASRVQKAEGSVEGLLRYLSLVALRGAFARDATAGAHLARALARSGTKGHWLELLRNALAHWDEAAVANWFGPAAASSRGFGASAAHASLDKLVELRNEVKYGGRPLQDLLRQIMRSIGQLPRLSDHRLFVPRAIEAQEAGLRTYKATLYRGCSRAFEVLDVTTELQFELRRAYLGLRGSHEVLPLDPLVLEQPRSQERELFVVDHADNGSLSASAVVSQAPIDDQAAREAHARLRRLATGVAPQGGWLLAARFECNDELPPNPHRHAPGDRIAGRFRIESLLESRGSTATYVAHDEELSRPVALKILPRSLARNPAALSGVLNEISVASSARHRNLVELIDRGDDGGDVYAVLELATGVVVGDVTCRDLSQEIATRARLKLGPLDEARVRALAEALARGLGALHAAGFLHHDLQPANVRLFDGAPHAKLGDFGFARPPEGRTSPRDPSGAESVRYLAPEHFDPARAQEIGPASDIYALGCVLYEALTLRAPYDGATESEVQKLHTSTKPRPLGDARPDVSPVLAATVHRCLAKTAAKRPQSCAEVLRALGAEGVPVVEDDEPALRPKPARQRRHVVFGLSTALLIAAAGFAWPLFRSLHAGSPSELGDDLDLAPGLARELVSAMCDDSPDERVDAVLARVANAVHRQRVLRGLRPEDPTPLVLEIQRAVEAASRLECLLWGLARRIDSRRHPLFVSDENLWRVVTCAAANGMTKHVGALEALSDACDGLRETDGAARFVASVRAMANENAWVRASAIANDGRLRADAMQSIVLRCDQVLRVDPPKLRFDFDGVRALALAELALLSESSPSSEARANALTALDAFLGEESATSARAAIERYFPVALVAGEWDAFQRRREQAEQLRSRLR